MVESGLVLGLYRALLPVVVACLPLAAPFSAKVRAGLAGRRGLDQRIADAAPRLRGCVWIHVTSVGEYEQARPIIAGLREQAGPDVLPIAVTHFSPSGYEYALRHPCADFHDYLPLDRRRDLRKLVDAWQPRMLVFVKFDFWPNQVLAAAERGVPILLLAGTLQPRSARFWPVARSVFRNLFDRFAHLGVCAAADRDRFTERLGVRCPVTVTGDTRAEQVILRYENAAAGEVAGCLREWGDTRLILGSTWPADERLWLPVLPDLLSRFEHLRVVLAPHEPRPERLEELEAALARRQISSCRLSRFVAAGAVLDGDPRCVLVDSVGVLAEIYRAGSLAYVGGSFTTGVHNTMEPAVAAMPVMFGPVFQNAMEAGTLVERGAGFVVRKPAEAAARVTALLADPDGLQQSGQLAREVVLAQRGATEKSLAVLQPYL